MTPEQLKISILQAAFQGKLVEQREEEGDGEKLYQTCIDGINSAIKHGIIKKSKSLNPITEDDLVFETPSSWKNVKLGEISQLVDGEKLKGKDYKYLEVKYLRGNIEPKIVNEGKFAKKGTLVILVDGENSGEVFTLPEDGYMGSTFKVLYIVETMDVDFVLKFFELKRSELRSNKKGAAIPHLNKDLLFNYVISIPPLEEQRRIVAKLEELLPFIDRYAEAYEKLEQFNAKFPEDMKKSILQYAIQGKLVEQRPEEGTAEELYQQIQDEKQKLIKEGKIKKEKPLAEISENEIPFDIPESWKWVRLNSVALEIGDIDHKMPEKVEDGIPYISPLDFTDNGIDYEHAKKISKKDYDTLSIKFKPSKNDIIFPRYGTIGKIRIIDTDREVLVSYSCCTIKNIDCYMDYLYVSYALQSQMIKSEIERYINKTTQPNVGLQSIKQFLFPLPPLEEQHRIVAKIEELLPYCSMLIR